MGYPRRHRDRRYQPTHAKEAISGAVDVVQALVLFFGDASLRPGNMARIVVPMFELFCVECVVGFKGM